MPQNAVPHTDIFAIDQSPFNLFLFAEVGTESNGSRLTILSLLARQGLDPWAEAARWAERSRTANIDRMVHLLAQIPLPTNPPRDARITATRLVLLLPPTGRASPGATVTRSAARRQWLMLAAFCAVLAMSVLVNSFATTSFLDGPTISAPAPLTATSR